jgi:predicted DNA binding CopG/RHH family protein
MPAKKVPITPKPVTPEANIEDWVATRSTSPEPVAETSPTKMKRLTIDVSETLHRALKLKSVEQGVPMADLVRDLLEQHFGSQASM